MRVLQVCPLFHPYIGGVETHVREISRRLRKSGVDIVVCTTDPSGRLPRKEVVDGIEVLRFRALSPYSLYFFSPQLYSAVRRAYDVDVVHAHAFPNFPALAAALGKRANGKPLIFTPHYGGYVYSTFGGSVFRTVAKRFYNPLVGKRLFDMSDAIVTLSGFEERFLTRDYGVDGKKVWRIPNGVDFERFSRVSVKASSCDLLYVGRVEKYKGVLFLLRVFLGIKDLFPDLRLVIVGKGAYKPRLVSMVKACGVGDRVQFYEDVPDEKLLELYGSASIFVSLSQFEGLPIALIEAMACGLPVVATAVGGVPDVVVSGKNGFLVDFPPDEEALGKLVSGLLADRELRVRIGNEARETALSRFSWEKTVNSLIRLYRTVSRFS